MIRKKSLLSIILVVFCVSQNTYLVLGIPYGIQSEEVIRQEEDLSISNLTTNCSLIDHYDKNIGNPLDVVTKGNIAFVTSDHSGLLIFNISNPSDPVLVNTLNPHPYYFFESYHFTTNKETYGKLIIEQNILFVHFYTDSNDVIAFYNITDPVFPTLENELSFTNYKDFIVDNNSLIVSHNHVDFSIYNISNLANPYPILNYSKFNGYNHRVRKIGENKLCLFNIFSDYLRFINISNTSAIDYYGDYPWSGDYLREVIFIDDIGFITSFSSFRIVNFSNINSPQTLDSYSVDYIFDMVLSDPFVYLVSSNRLIILDISDRENIQLLSNNLVFGSIRTQRLHLRNDLLFALEQAGMGLHIANISQKETPVEIGAYYFGKYTHDIAWSENELYYANGYGDGIHTLNRANHSQLAEMPDKYHDMDLEDLIGTGSYLFGEFNGIIYALDSTDTPMTTISSYRPDPIFATDDFGVISNDSLVVLSASELQLVKFDGNSFSLIDTLQLEKGGRSITVYDDLICVSLLEALVFVKYNKDDGTLKHLKTDPFDYTIQEVRLERTKLIVHDYDNHIFVYSYNDRLSLNNAKQYQLVSDFAGFYTQGDYLYILHNASLEVLNIHEEIIKIANYPVNLCDVFYPEKVKAEYENIYLALGVEGLKVVQLTMPDSDNDFLPDWLENNVYGTNSTNQDTDGDGIMDGIEVFEGTNPASDTGLTNASTFAKNLPQLLVVCFSAFYLIISSLKRRKGRRSKKTKK
jgi:hypothetical protein